jgi:hypothetical protein
MKIRNTWMTPGPPWELHLLSLVFILVAIAVPLYVNYLAVPDPGRTLLQEAMHPGRPRLPHFITIDDLAWSGALVLFAALTLLMSRFRADRNSTPIPAFLAPLFFSFIAYYRLYSTSLTTAGSSAAIVTASPGQLMAWGAATLAAVFLVARLRLARYALRFRDVKWDLASAARHDKTFFSLAVRILPLIYEPRTYRVSDQGMLIEGWFYMLVIPFELVQSVSEARRPGSIYAGEYFATNLNDLIRFQIAGQSLPVFISPDQHAEFLAYCQKRVKRLHRQTTLVGAPPQADMKTGEPRG